MVKYLVTGSIALSVLYLLSEISIEAFGNMLKVQKETKIPIKVQIKNAIKKLN